MNTRSVNSQQINFNTILHNTRPQNGHKTLYPALVTANHPFFNINTKDIFLCFVIFSNLNSHSGQK